LAYELGFYCVLKQRYAKNSILDQQKIINTETPEEQGLKFVRLPLNFFGGFVQTKVWTAKSVDVLIFDGWNDHPSTAAHLCDLVQRQHSFLRKY